MLGQYLSQKFCPNNYMNNTKQICNRTSIERQTNVHFISRLVSRCAATEHRASASDDYLDLGQAV